MAKQRVKLHYIDEWMRFRGVSLRRLRDRLEHAPGEELISLSSLVRIKNGEQAPTPEVIHAIAAALQCQPGDLFNVNPLLHPELIDLMEVIRRLKGKDRIIQATNVLRAIA